ncbi:MAG: J domain-containing protein [Proteobacteria bacterium]|nr:J domain-containing protein [Pseudomonadota bacterium]
MNLPFDRERRDPVSGVLMLGSILMRSHRECDSGQVEVRDREKVHAIQLVRGTICDVLTDGLEADWAGPNKPNIERQLQRLFSMSRPHVLWMPGRVSRSGPAEIDPESAVIGGVIRRQDLFDPLPLVQRIPVDTLQVDVSQRTALRRMLSIDELEFINRLAVPTPIPMILWKRGLTPQHAGALLVALNLIGLFKGQWEPGDLPRIDAVTRIRRKLKAAVRDHELLGIDEEAPEEAVDQAFKKLSYQLHPDRLHGLPDREVSAARIAFVSASAAYTRLKRLRRSRPVQHRDTSFVRVESKQCQTDRLVALLAETRAAFRRGEPKRARAFALKALATAPPEEIRNELLNILKLAA